MKKIITTIALSAFLLCASTSAVKAQDYDHAIGLTVGSAVGVSYKTFLSKASAVEAGVNFYYNHNAPMILAVYQYHIPLLEGFKFYAGGGLNIGVMHLGNSHGYYNSAKFALGVDPTIGFEYKFNNAPIALALDYTPMINIFGHSMWENAQFKVRFTL